jgi:nucleotide-binding universal stress UspA family protein
MRALSLSGHRDARVGRNETRADATARFAQYGGAGQAARETAEHYVLQTADRLRATHGGTISATILDGRAASAIATHAAATGADLIVMGSHGRTGAKRVPAIGRARRSPPSRPNATGT